MVEEQEKMYFDDNQVSGIKKNMANLKSILKTLYLAIVAALVINTALFLNAHYLAMSQDDDLDIDIHA
jgi:hypothetical protein